MSLFNQTSLMEIDLLYQAGLQSKTIAEKTKRILISRHGSEDFTITTQEEMLEVLGSVLGIVTMAVGGLGAISLLVGGVGILTIMTIAVDERTPEIGLLRAIGAGRNEILLLFIGEAVVLAAIGGWPDSSPAPAGPGCWAPWCRPCRPIPPGSTHSTPRSWPR
jgi:putative ABC transport system permease protein